MPKERQLPFGWTIESVKNLQEERDELKEENTEQYCEILDLQKENEKLKEDIETSEDNVMNITEERDEYFGETEKLKEEIDELKKQIPDKKGKKLSQADKDLLWDIAIAWERGDGAGSDEEEGKKLIYRLLK